MGAPVGNTNRATQYRLQREIETVFQGESTSENLEGLRSIIRAQFAKAQEGDTQAFKELMDRWAGKPVASTEISGPDGGPMVLEKVARVIVDPANPNG